MINIEINNKIYEFPQKWEEVTLRKYLEIINLPTEMGNIERSIKLVGILGGIEENILYRLSVNELNKIDISFVIKPFEITEVKEEFIINDKTFRVVDYNSLTMGEFILVEELFKEDYQKKYGELISIILRPTNESGIIDNYNQTLAKQYKELFLDNLNIQDIFSIFVFFCGGEANYTTYMKDFLNKMK